MADLFNEGFLRDGPNGALIISGPLGAPVGLASKTALAAAITAAGTGGATAAFAVAGYDGVAANITTTYNAGVAASLIFEYTVDGTTWFHCDCTDTIYGNILGYYAALDPAVGTKQTFILDVPPGAQAVRAYADSIDATVSISIRWSASPTRHNGAQVVRFLEAQEVEISDTIEVIVQQMPSAGSGFEMSASILGTSFGPASVPSGCGTAVFVGEGGEVDAGNHWSYQASYDQGVTWYALQCVDPRVTPIVRVTTDTGATGKFLRVANCQGATNVRILTTAWNSGVQPAAINVVTGTPFPLA